MAIVINGSGTVTGISVGGLPDDIVDSGTLASDALDSAVTINDTGADVDFRVESDDNANMLFVDGGEDRVGIGTATPDVMLHIEAASNAIFRVEETDGSYGELEAGGSGVHLKAKSGGYITLRPNDTETLRITTTGAIHTPSFTNDGSVYGFKLEGSDQQYTFYQAQLGNGNFDFHRYYNSDGYIGRIRWSSSSLSFENLSDYRAKENVVDITDATARLLQLKPKRYNLPNNVITLDGFLAHEVSPVCPEAVGGEKDAVDEDGNPEMQMMDNSKLIPLLTSALQEAIARIETLETKVTALENA